MKGIAFAFGLVLIQFLIIIAVIMPAFFLVVHIDRNIVYETRYTNAQLVLLSLLTSTQKDSLDGSSKQVYEILVEYIVLDNKPRINFIKPLLDMLIESKSYKLYYIENGQEIILGQSGDPSKYTAKTKILIPYNSDQLYKELILVVD